MNLAFQLISSIFPLPLATFIPILSHFSFHLFFLKLPKMSFRELRDAIEILRALGYPRLVSMENFRFPNFPLMAEILEWTVKKFDPNVRFPKQLDSEQDRLIFVKSAVLILLQKAHIRLNPKNIYQSDGHAIRELLPLLKMLYDGRHDGGGIGQNGKGEEDFDSMGINALRAQLNAKRQQLRQGVQLAGEMPKSGANLYELLRDEIFAKETRNRALGQSLNATQVEKEIKERIRETEQKIGEFKQRLENIGNDEQEMAKKVERRRRELDQLQKRLAKLQSFRPPYMDEYERYERELKAHYEIYVVLFRNLHYLQQQLAQAENAEREQAVNAEHSMRVAVEKMRMEREEESPAAIAGINKEGGGILLEDEDELKPSKIRVFGNMTGTGISDDEEEDEDGGRIIEVEDDDEEEEEDDPNGERGFRRGMGEEEDKTFINDDEHAESVGEEENHAANDF